MKKIIIKKPQKKKKISPRIVFCSFLIMALAAIWLGAYYANKYPAPSVDTPVSKVDNSNTKPDYISEKNIKAHLSGNDDTIATQPVQTTEKITENTGLSAFDSDTEIKTSHIVLPVSGDIIKPFSDTDLIYSETMSDYRTHTGIDISSHIGNEVICPQNGRITEISRDDALGYSISIDHGNMISKISNLSSKIDVKVGDKVNLGQKIAITGDSAQYEIMDEPHIHYELNVNGVNVNPLEYVQ